MAFTTVIIYFPLAKDKKSAGSSMVATAPSQEISFASLNHGGFVL